MKHARQLKMLLKFSSTITKYIKTCLSKSKVSRTKQDAEFITKLVVIKIKYLSIQVTC